MLTDDFILVWPAGEQYLTFTAEEIAAAAELSEATQPAAEEAGEDLLDLS